MSLQSKSQKKRQGLFQVFSNNLKLLIDNEIIKELTLKSDHIYICPICLNQFTIDDLNPRAKNRLTLEDVPPRSLRGHQIALTCHSCNSICGHQIDFHLLERMKELDFEERIEGATKKARFHALGKTVNGEIRVLKDGKTKVFHDNDTNDPKELEEYIRIVRTYVGNDIIKCEPEYSGIKYTIESGV